MHNVLRLPSLFLVCAAVFLGCKKEEPIPAPAPVAPATTTLTMDAVSPASGSKVSASTTITATLTYALSDNQQSTNGFEVFAQFQTTNGTQTIGTSTANNVVLTNRSGKINVSAPLAQVWNDSRLSHPITAYFYLLNKTSTGGGTVIAKVGPIVYTE
jgi:hypothetical protein